VLKTYLKHCLRKKDGLIEKSYMILVVVHENLKWLWQKNMVLQITLNPLAGVAF